MKGASTRACPDVVPLPKEVKAKRGKRASLKPHVSAYKTSALTRSKAKDKPVAGTYLEANSTAVQTSWWCNRLESSLVSWRVQRPVGTLLWRATDSNSHARITALMPASRPHATTLCCLLPRTYGAWRAEPCQKHLQRLLPGLTERRVGCEMRKEIKKVFEVWYIECGRGYGAFRA